MFILLDLSHFWQQAAKGCFHTCADKLVTHILLLEPAVAVNNLKIQPLCLAVLREAKLRIRNKGQIYVYIY